MPKTASEVLGMLLIDTQRANDSYARVAMHDGRRFSAGQCGGNSAGLWQYAVHSLL
jgi:hypothetical protein